MKIIFLFLFLMGQFKPCFFQEQKFIPLHCKENGEDQAAKNREKFDLGFEKTRSDFHGQVATYKRAMETRVNELNLPLQDFEAEIQLLDRILGTPGSTANTQVTKSEQKSDQGPMIAKLLGDVEKLTAKVNANHLQWQKYSIDSYFLFSKVLDKAEDSEVQTGYIGSNLTQKMTNLEESVNGVRTMATSETKKLQDLIISQGNCYLSAHLNLTTISTGQQYHFTTENFSWREGRNFCFHFGMTMALIETREEFEAIKLHAGGYWVSANDIGKEPGNYHWTNGYKVDSSWMSGLNQFGPGKETCLYIDSSRITDYSCSSSIRVLCKRPAHCTAQ